MLVADVVVVVVRQPPTPTGALARSLTHSHARTHAALTHEYTKEERRGEKNLVGRLSFRNLKKKNTLLLLLLVWLKKRDEEIRVECRVRW